MISFLLKILIGLLQSLMSPGILILLISLIATKLQLLLLVPYLDEEWYDCLIDKDEQISIVDDNFPPFRNQLSLS